MTEYLSYKFTDTPDAVDTFDELPLWSAPFGLLMLKHLPIRPNLIILDIGSGAGFPLLEIAGRFGSSCKCYGLDPWINANERARHKAGNYGIRHVTVLDGSAEAIPFDDGSVDLIVSNLGINNFDRPAVVFEGCIRVLKPGGCMALTTNLNGHWKEFYTVFESTLHQLGRQDLIAKLILHQQHRGTTETISAMFTDAGFEVTTVHEDWFSMRFLDGTAFLNHYFVKLGWLGSWMGLLEGEDLNEIFSLLERNLNTYAAASGELYLTVPMAYIEGTK